MVTHQSSVAITIVNRAGKRLLSTAQRLVLSIPGLSARAANTKTSRQFDQRAFSIAAVKYSRLKTPSRTSGKR